MTESRYELTLLDAAHQGNPDAINQLLHLAQPDIRRYAYLNCKAADAGEAVQETLFAMLRRKCVRMAKLVGLRGGETYKTGEDEYLLLKPVDELRHDLGMAIQSLPEHYRAIILLRDIEEMSIAEIAATLQQTRESIKEKLGRARLMLREYLRDS